jgi:hypothetical protein
MRLLRTLTYGLFIHTKTTPNPHFLKFIPAAKVVMGAQEPIDIPSL